MSLVRLNIKGISYSQTQNGAYALILNEVDGDRKLPIVIGAFEAQSIAIALEKDFAALGRFLHQGNATFLGQGEEIITIGFFGITKDDTAMRSIAGFTKFNVNMNTPFAYL